MYEEFYSFSEKPFNIVPDPDFLYLSAKHRTALTYLEYGVMDRVGFVVLTGEIGTGKTTLIKQLLKQVPGDVNVAVVFNTNVSSEQLLELIIDEFELELPPRGKAGYLDTLNQFLITQYGQRKRSLLIVDEAQNLSQEALEEIRMLSNLQSDKESLLQIVLVGQPPLRTRLHHPSLAQLRQRISVSYHLAPLTKEETTGYIGHRLQVAGASDGKPFSAQAVERIFYHSGGIPRTINILCDAALVYGYADQLTTIDESIIEQVVSHKQVFDLSVPSSAGDGMQLPAEGCEGNGDLLHRLEGLEQRVNHVSVLVERQAQEGESRADSYKDTLVRRLEKLLTEERRRSDRLLVKYNLLRNRLNLTEMNSQEKKVEPSKKKGPAAIGETEPASPQDKPRSGWSQRFGNSLRKIFSL
jgi:general secretion pathway protein A